MTDGFFGELYLRTTRPFLSKAVTELEATYLRRMLFDGLAPGPVLDLGCGDGRHLALLSDLPVVGVELDARSLAEAPRLLTAVRADFWRLPFADGSCAGAYAFYSTLFFGDRDHLPLLREVRRVLRPGGVLLFQTVPRERLEAEPTSHFEGELPDGGRIVDDAVFDAARSLEQGTRTYVRPDGSVLCAPYTIRYYPRPRLERLLTDAGFTPRFWHGDLFGGPLSEESRDLLVGAERRDG